MADADRMSRALVSRIPDSMGTSGTCTVRARGGGGRKRGGRREAHGTEQMGRRRRRRGTEWRTVRVGAEALLGHVRLEAASVRLGETLLLRAHALRLHQHRTAAFLQSIIMSSSCVRLRLL